MNARQILQKYYWATPAFILIDWTLGVNVRAAAFEDHPSAKILYYGLCLGCSAIGWRWPSWMGVTGLLESSANVLALTVGVLAPYYRFIGMVGEPGADLTSPITLSSIINFLLAGTMATISFHQTQSTLASRP